MCSVSARKRGKIYLVGAGPGSTDLITIRGAELLKSADCVIYDRLVNPALLSYAAADAEIIPVPKRIGPASVTQQQINKLLIEKACAGKTVVRLKGGDPCVFGRGAEEARVIAGAGIDFEIVPGVTAAIAAAEYAGIMLTDRHYSSQLLFVTGKEAREKKKSDIDWNLLGRFSGTIVFYMAVGNLDFIVTQLIENGMKHDTPAAVIADATKATQKLIKAPIRELPQKCKAQDIQPPAVVVIGAAAKINAGLNWFMKKPLFGKNIVITRDVAGNADFAAKIIRAGGNPVPFPTIKIKPLTQTNRFLRTLEKISEFDWIVFTSANGVAVVVDVLKRLEKDARVFASAKIAAIGVETAAELARFGIKADLVPTIFTGTELARQLAGFADLRAKKILLLRSRLASDRLRRLLSLHAAHVENVPVYTTITLKTNSDWLIEMICGKKVDWLTFASPSSASGFFEQIDVKSVNSSDVRVASIGPVTSQRLSVLGVRIHAEAHEHTIEGLLDTIKTMH